MLLQHKNIEINHQDGFGRTALNWASYFGYKDIVKILLQDERIEINQQDKDGKTALMWATYKDHKEINEMLEAKEKWDQMLM